MKKALFSLLLTIACLPMALGQQPAYLEVATSEAVACGSYTWIDGNVYTHDTIATYIHGDTVYVLELTVTAPSIDTTTATPLNGGCTVEWNNKSWDTPGIYIDTIRAEAVGQCDSVVKIEIILAGTETLDQLIETACDHYVTPWGDTLTSTVSATDTIVATSACSLTIGQLDITIHKTDTTATEVIASAEGCAYEWNGIAVNVPDSTYYSTLTATTGCDSVASVKVTAFTGSTSDTTLVDACDFYLDGNDTITASTFLTTADSTGECLAYHVVAVTIHPSYRDTTSTVARDTIGGCTLTWGNTTYHLGDSIPSTPLYAYGRTAMGCDSLMAIRITSFNGTSHDTTFVDYCGDRYIWRHGNTRDTLTTDGEYTNSTTTDRCTTVQHLMLTFHDEYDTIDVDSVCGSYTYTFDSRAGVAGQRQTATFTTTGTHDTDENGVPIYSTHFSTRCITHHAVIVKIKEPENRGFTLNIDTTVCDEYRFTFNNITYTWTESADSNLVSSRRTMRSCYDVYGHVKLTVNKRDTITINKDTCDFFIWRGYTDETYTSTTRTSLILPDTTTAAGCRVVALLNLTINYTPVVTIEGDWELEKDSTDETTLTAVCDEPINSYKWYRDGRLEAGQTSNVFVVKNIDNNTDIHLESTSNNGCVAHNWLTITYNVGIDEADDIAVNIYPNPATRYLNIESAESLKEIVIYNAIGQQVVVSPVDGNRTTLDLSSLASGNYTMRISSANGEQTTRKFIVNK